MMLYRIACFLLVLQFVTCATNVLRNGDGWSETKTKKSKVNIYVVHVIPVHVHTLYVHVYRIEERMNHFTSFSAKSKIIFQARVNLRTKFSATYVIDNTCATF